MGRIRADKQLSAPEEGCFIK